MTDTSHEIRSEITSDGTLKLSLESVEKPEPKDGEVLIKIEACGVCHSQLHGIEGDWKEIGIPPTLPTVPGHEVVGKIVEVGEKVTKFQKVMNLFWCLKKIFLIL